MVVKDFYRLSQKQFKFSGFLYIPLIILSFVISLWVGTEYIYHQALAASFDLGHHSWFSSLAWVIAPNLGALDPIITKGLHITLGMLFISLILVYVLHWYLQRDFKETDTHGSARWANFKDIEN